MIGENTKVSFLTVPMLRRVDFQVGQGILWFLTCYQPAVGIGGVYGTWGESYDNESCPFF